MPPPANLCVIGLAIVANTAAFHRHQPPFVSFHIENIEAQQHVTDDFIPLLAFENPGDRPEDRSLNWRKRSRTRALYRQADACRSP
jgi:hypothetical protein